MKRFQEVLHSGYFPPSIFFDFQRFKSNRYPEGPRIRGETQVPSSQLFRNVSIQREMSNEEHILREAFQTAGPACFEQR